MLRKIFLPVILVALGYGFWISADFKEISAGVAIFLFGMIVLEEGFRTFSGGVLEKVLKKSTDKLYKSISFGFITTALMQSSSLVSLLTISFLGAGLVGLYEGVGIIFGANIGTTTGAWLMAGFGLKVKISAYAMPMLVFGVIMIFQKSKTIKGIGYILTGLGFLFLGIHHMKEGFETFKNGVDLAQFAVGGLKGIMLFILIGLVATVVMQSSHATIILVITALSVGQINYENAIALTIGANIGTTITAIIGSLSSNVDGKRLAGAHLIFNVTTAVIAVIFFNQIVYIVSMMADMLGIGAENYTLRLAVFDSFFKIMGVIIMVPFINKLVTFLESFIKPKKSRVGSSGVDEDYSRYLNESVLGLPETAFTSIIKETKHLYDNAFEIIIHGLNLKRINVTSTMDFDEVVKDNYSKEMPDMDELYEHKIKGIYGNIIDFATKAQSSMPHEYVKLLYRIKLANRDLVEAVKDTKHLQKNLKKFLNSENEAIKTEYNNIRKYLVSILRDINTIATTTEADVIILLLSRVRLHVKKNDLMANGSLDHLIRNDLITNEMATSFMNDTAYASDIGMKLIAMAEIIFILSNDKIKSLDEDLLVNQEDINLLTNEGVRDES